MAFSFSKIFKPKETIVVAANVIDQIDYKGGTKYAKNETNIVYADIEELGGFPYLKTVIIGDTKANIKRTGCTISFIFKNDEITLASDNTTIESNKIKNSNVFYTEIDFELDENDAKKIKSQKVNEVKYTFKKSVAVFKTI